MRNLTDVKQVIAGSYSSCALKNNGTVWCWGYNSYGNLGDGTTPQRRTSLGTGARAHERLGDRLGADPQMRS